MPTDSIRDKAAEALLQPPALGYVRSLQRHLDRDPQYIESHKEDIGNIIVGFLSGSGFHWTREIFEREWPGILQESLRILSKKKQ